MLGRWVGFIVAVLIVHRVLTWLPVVGPFLSSFGIFGVWISALVAGALLQRLARSVLEHRRFGAQIREWSTVESPHNQGKLGTLYADAGRMRRALPLLREAAEGEPDSPEWAYQRGRVALNLGELEEAIEALTNCVERNEEHRYGEALMRLTEARVRAGGYEEALADLERFERNHGENPESAYRRGDALKRAGRKEEARTAFARVAEAARSVPKYQRASARMWVIKARLAAP